MKYYTPKITEFHVGFEYQEYQRKEWDKMIRPPDNLGYEWVTKTFNTSTSLSKIKSQITGANGMDLMLDGVDQEHSNCKIRVKYLDKQDILAFGFEYYKMGIFTKDGEKRLVMSTDNNVEICDDYTIFLGKIKNKSELRKLLTQLEITIY